MDMKPPSKAIQTGVAMLAHEDMREREESILLDISELTKFLPEEVIWRSDYLGTGRVGAVHYRGRLDGKEVVLKIQGVRPDVSEAFMIEEFQKQNKSKLIRPPYVYQYLPWNEGKQYEAFLMESVRGKKVIESKKLLTAGEIESFIEIYKEYKRNCVSKPWLPKPADDDLAEELIQRVKKMMEEIKPNSPNRQAGDLDLAIAAANVLKKIWQNEELEFVHGHFSAEDLMWQGQEMILFSNLFWKWKYPFYDLVFAYHWLMYGLASVEGVTPEQIEDQRSLWLSEIRKTAQELNPEKGLVLVNGVLLERAIAGLLVDGHAYLDETKPITAHLITETRNQLVSLMKSLS